MAPDAGHLLRVPHLGYVVAAIAVAAYVLRSPPLITNRIPLPADPGLASLPRASRPREIYPEDYLDGGAYVTLPRGRVRYWVVGPEDGKRITLVHGVSIPSIVFTRLVPILTGAGYRVLLYDLYGRGYSDAPRDAPYDTALYITQLALLLQHVGWEKTRLLGFSMGGGITAAFVATFPDLVEREVVLVASVGALESPPPLARFRHLPFVGHMVLRRLLRGATPQSQNPLQQLVYHQSISLPGFRRAVVSSLYDGPVAFQRWAFQAPEWAGRRVLLIHGTKDLVVPPPASLRLRAWLSSAGAAELAHVEVEGAGHDVTWTHAEEVGRALLEFLAGSASAAE